MIDSFVRNTNANKRGKSAKLPEEIIKKEKHDFADSAFVLRIVAIL